MAHVGARERAFPVGGARGPRIVIVGAGVAGILMGHKLRERGLTDFQILEKAATLGGTWRDNRYPGLACDIPAHAYTYSFRPNAGWTSDFAGGPEIWRYYDAAARDYGVKPHMRFHQEVTQADWEGNHWTLRTAAGDEFKCDILISAVGRLHHPRFPEIDGLGTFSGPQFHSAQWPDGVSLKGKRVGLIGTGSTATQIIAAVADEVRELSVFQRTPQWVMPVPNNPIRWWRRVMYRLFPRKLHQFASALRTFIEDNASNIAHGKGLDQIRAGCEAGLGTVRDPALRAKLTPTYEPGCKRLVMSGTFFEAIQKPTVKLITEGIERVEPAGVRTKDETLHAVDILILATGFKADWYLKPTKVSGVNGTTLDSLWQNGPLNYRSVSLPDMPNLFFLNGPYSPGGSSSIVDVIEAQAGYVLQLLDHVVHRRVALTPKRDVTEEMLEEVRSRGRKTVWATGGCKSWYLDKDGVPLYNPLSIRQLREQLATPQWEHFNEIPLTP